MKSDKIKLLKSVIPVNTKNDGNRAFISMVNFFGNTLLVITVAANEDEAKKLIDEMLEQGFKNPDSHVSNRTYENWLQREYSLDFDPLYSIDISQRGVYIFKAPNLAELR